MAIIRGLNKGPARVIASPSSLDEAVEVSVLMFRYLSLVGDEQELRDSLTVEFGRLIGLGRDGRLYIRLPSWVETKQLIELAGELAFPRGYGTPFTTSDFWEAVRQEDFGSTEHFEAQLALFRTNSYSLDLDPLLHFTELPYDDRRLDGRKVTQLSRAGEEREKFAKQYPGTAIDTCGLRDYLVWYIMDTIRGVLDKEFVLGRGSMRIPQRGRRDADRSLSIGRVSSRERMAILSTDDHCSNRYGIGVGLTVRFVSGEERY